MPDTIGTQETHLKWINALTGSPLLSDYELVGEQRYGDEVPRTQNDNEASAILYRKSKFNLIDSGTYWLSETPEVVNSKLEESKYVRIMTYVVLERKSDGVKFVHVNTHLNSTPELNLRQVQIMLDLVNEKIYSKHGKLPTFYTGDFNADPASENNDGYKYLISTGTENSRVVAEVTSNENTIKNGGMIDHCIVTKNDFLVTFFDVGQERPGEDRSNHYPVYVKMYITHQN
jgi:endonuclease/exonuclease/phosphatase family metal-dependent hydrolase